MVSREEKLSRYRHLRAINKRQQSDALNLVPRVTMLDCARRLGLARGRTLILDNPDDVHLVYDLVVHVGKGGRFRAIDRYAEKVQPAPGSDDAMMLAAARNAQFAILNVERRHETVGLHVLNVITEETLWLIDESIEATGRNGLILATRLMTVDDFVMTCGALVLVDELVMLDAWKSMPRWSPTSKVELAQDPRFVLSVYRAAIRTGMTEGTAYRDPGKPNLLEVARVE